MFGVDAGRLHLRQRRRRRVVAYTGTHANGPTLNVCSLLDTHTRDTTHTHIMSIYTITLKRERTANWFEDSENSEAAAAAAAAALERQQERLHGDSSGESGSVAHGYNRQQRARPATDDFGGLEAKLNEADWLGCVCGQSKYSTSSRMCGVCATRGALTADASSVSLDAPLCAHADLAAATAATHADEFIQPKRRLCTLFYA